MPINTAFSRQILDDSRAVLAASRTVDPISHRVTERDLDEYEFYVTRIGNRWAHLMSLMTQLSESVAFLDLDLMRASVRQTGMTQHRFLLFATENFLIRTTSLADRALKLVDAVCHLGLHPGDVRYNTVRRNIHVTSTSLLHSLAELNTFARQYVEARNTIIHHAAYSDDPLRNLELSETLLTEMRAAGEEPTGTLQFLPDITDELVEELCSQKTSEYRAFCTRADVLIVTLFEEFLPVYAEKKRQLLLICGYERQYGSRPGAG